jgi:hypothetical protein
MSLCLAQRRVWVCVGSRRWCLRQTPSTYGDWQERRGWCEALELAQHCCAGEGKLRPEPGPGECFEQHLQHTHDDTGDGSREEDACIENRI